jgi:uridine kinase
MNYVKTKEINKNVQINKLAFIGHSEKLYHEQINRISDEIILDRTQKPIILLSGPSGSGKTTTAKRIEAALIEAGLRAMTISLDNYFHPKTSAPKIPLCPDGSEDYESPYRMDVELLNTHIAQIIEGKEIEIPVFDFVTQSRPKTIPFKRRENQVIIFEGIHALNPLINGNGFGEHTMCVYVSVRTRIKTEDGNYLHPQKIRLMRRIIRDKLFRARTAEDTVKMLENVSRGEDLYIMPYKHRATFDVDTFLKYEASVYAPIIKKELNDLVANNKYVDRISDLLPVVNELIPVTGDVIGERSLIREFIGGSELDY